ncbi:N-terminal EF-hand calcium-binding protein 3 isoform X5 [Equus caballus]|uniref:N-terminal EF-hand calcium-binding protein 3 isoform X5 n=1 Tax=Equus caballus TaxID=9796 RepID=UPI0003ACAF54
MMMVSSHLRNSRITLLTGFSVRGSCGSSSEALMGTPLNYFSEHLGVYQPVLAALESLNRAVLTAMDTTKLEYERASKVDQFVTRFLLRETVSQLQALQSSLEGASDTLEAQALGPRSDEDSVEVQSRPRGSRRAGRRALRSVSWSPTWSPGSSDTGAPVVGWEEGPGRVQQPQCPQCLLFHCSSVHPQMPPKLSPPGPPTPGQSSEAELQWRLQVNRLQELIDQLECKAPRLEPLHEEELTKGPDSHILVAQRQMQVAEEALQDFHRALCCYVDFTGAQSHCLHVSAQKMLDNASFTLYEFWQDEASWRRHRQSACSKAFQRILIDHLRAPDTLTTVFFPASWWIMNNN